MIIIKRALFPTASVFILAAAFFFTDGLYHYAEAQGEASRVAELDAGVAATGAAETHLDGKGPTVAPPVSPAPPDPAPAPESNPVDSVRDVVSGARTGNWRLLAGGVITLLMLGLKTSREKFKWFRGDRGGAVAVLSLSFLGALGASLATGLPIDLRMLAGVVGVAFTAAGGYSVVKSLFWPANKAAA